MSELKPCPFCGGKDVRPYTVAEGRVAIMCWPARCSAEGPWRSSAKAAIAAWNRRPGWRPPDGWVLVPVEPTIGMLRALTNKLGKGSEEFAAKWSLGTFRDDYAAMLAAAPPLPAPPEPTNA